jgi:hypothetical protein
MAVVLQVEQEQVDKVMLVEQVALDLDHHILAVAVVVQAQLVLHQQILQELELAVMEQTIVIKLVVI